MFSSCVCWQTVDQENAHLWPTLSPRGLSAAAPADTIPQLLQTEDVHFAHARTKCTSPIKWCHLSFRCNLSRSQCKEGTFFLSIRMSDAAANFLYQQGCCVHLSTYCLFLWEDRPSSTCLTVCCNRGHASSPQGLLGTPPHTHPPARPRCSCFCPCPE